MVALLRWYDALKIVFYSLQARYNDCQTACQLGASGTLAESAGATDIGMSEAVL